MDGLTTEGPRDKVLSNISHFSKHFIRIIRLLIRFGLIVLKVFIFDQKLDQIIKVSGLI